MSFPISTWRVLEQVFGRDSFLGRMRGTRRHLLAQRAASELRASERRFRSLFDAAPVAIAITRAGVLLYVNEAAVELLGCSDKSEMIGEPVENFVAPPDRETMQKRIERRAQGFDEPLIYEAAGRRQGGEEMPLRIEVKHLQLPDGAATLAFAFDLRAERAAQIQREALLLKARRAALFAGRLQQLTSALAASHAGEAVADLVVSLSVAALEARAGALSMPVASTKSGFDLAIVAARGYPAQIIADYERLPITPNSPLPAVLGFTEGRPMWVENVAQIERELPLFGGRLPDQAERSLCVLPLEFEERILGVLNLSFEKPQEFDAETRAFMLTLASQCAAALERARLLSEAQGAARLQRESLALLDTLLDTAPVGFAFFDLQGRYVLVNHALARINRASVSDHLGRTISEILPGVGERLEAMIGRVVSSGEPSGEIEILGVPVGDGDAVLHALIAFYPVRGAGSLSTRMESDARNEILGVGSVVIDISARVDAERDRVQLMGELEIERARFEAILQQMPSGVMIAEAPQGRIILDNSQVAQIWRHAAISASDVEGYSVYHGFHFDGSPLAAEEWPLARAIQRGEEVRGEEVMIERGDGTSGVIRLNAAPIRDRDGNVTAGVVIFDDVTERARAEAAQRFLAEAGSALVATLDERQCYEQIAQLCVPGVADWCLIAAPGEDGLLSQISLAGGEADEKLRQNSAPTDEFSPRELAATLQNALLNDPQLPWELSGVLRDSFLDSTGDTAKSNAAEDATETALSGARRGEVLAQNPEEKLAELSSDPAFRRFIASLEVQSALVTPLQARGQVLGLMIWISAASKRHYDESDLELADEIGRRAALAAANARLFHEAELARDEAQNANRAKDEFLAVVSHELRTPLTPILGWLELLRSPDAGDEIRVQAYDVIERNARAQAQLINDILDVSRITTGKLRLEIKPLSLAEVVARAAEMLRPTAREKNIDLQLDLGGNANASSGEDEDEDEEIVALADANRLQQIVWNLLQNALKFTPDGGAVRVSLRADSEAELAILEVEDSGVGIDAEFLPHVFDRFRQADSSSTRRAGGLGLGLAIVAHIVEGHGGKVGVSSAGKGRGATFRVELPLLPASALTKNNPKKAAPLPVAQSKTKPRKRTAPDATAPPKSESISVSTPLPIAQIAPKPAFAARFNLQGLPVLVVDDEPDTRAMLQAILEKSGARVTTAARAQDALWAWVESPHVARPALLICDIAMPGMDGHELRRELKKAGFAAPSIALSAYTAAADVQKALDAGFDAHLAKPIDAESLLTLATQLCAPKSAR